MYKHTWHVAPNGANHYLVSLGYKHAAPPEQRQLTHCRLSGFQFDEDVNETWNY